MFQFRYDYTLEDMNALSRVSAKTYRRKKVLIYRTVLTLLGAAYLAMGALLLSHRSWLWGGIIFAAGVFFSAVTIFYHQGTAWRTKRMMLEEDSDFTVTLDEEGICGKGVKGQSAYPYSAIASAYHYKGRYFLFIDKRHALLIPERALIQGDSAGLRSFLTEKLGKDIQELH